MASLNCILTRRQALQLLAAAAASHLITRDGSAQAAARVLKVAISTDTLAGANVNDARAAYKVWVTEVSRHFPSTVAQMVPEIFLPSDELIRKIRLGTIECFGVTALEFAKVADLIDSESLLLQDYLSDGMEYVLLVHDKNPMRKVADLRGAQLLTHFHRDMVLAPAWLGTLLAANNLPQPDHFFGSQKATDNLDQVILPVFFRRADAACIARRNFDTAVELNPQLGRDLRAIAVSPRIVPIAIAFRKGCNPEGRKVLIDSILNVSSLAAGKQIIALYQSHGFIERPTAVMSPTLEMIRRFQRLTLLQPEKRKATT